MIIVTLDDSLYSHSDHIYCRKTLRLFIDFVYKHHGFPRKLVNQNT